MASIVISHKYSHTRPDGLVIFQGTCFNTDFLPSPDLGPFLGNLDKVIPQLDIIDLVPKTLQVGTNYDGYVPDVPMYIIGASIGANTDNVGLLGDTKDSMWIVRAYTAVYTHIAPVGGVTIIPDSAYTAPQRQTHYESPWGGASGGAYWTPKTASMGWKSIAYLWHRDNDPYQLRVFPAYMHYFDGMPSTERWFGHRLNLFHYLSYNADWGVQIEWQGPEYDPDRPIYFYPDDYSWVSAKPDLRIVITSMGSQDVYDAHVGIANRPVFWYPSYMSERDTSGGRNYGGGYPSLQGLSSDCYNWLIDKWL